MWKSGELPKPKLGLNCVGGASGLELCKVDLTMCINQALLECSLFCTSGTGRKGCACHLWGNEQKASDCCNQPYDIQGVQEMKKSLTERRYGSIKTDPK